MKKTTLILLSLLLFTGQLFSEAKSYALKEINYDIKGSTNKKILERKFNYHKGMVFKDLEEIESFVTNLEQELHNLRYYEEISVTTEIENNLITLNIYLDEAWGIIPFGIPKVNSEKGVRASFKLFWFNTLGTLTNTSLIGGFNVSKDPGDEDFEIQEWNARLKFADIYLLDRYFNINFEQALDRDSKDDAKWSFHSSSMSVGTSFNILDLFDYSPNISLTASYTYKPVMNIDKKDINTNPFRLTYSHGVGGGNINWIGNLQDGVSYGISNNLHLVWADETGVTPSADFTLSGKIYKKLGKLPISVGSRLTGILSVNEELLGLGSNNRGVDSGDMYGSYGIFSNSNIYISVIKLKGLAEAIFAPSFDFGITEHSDLKYSAGADFVLYVDKLKSLTARGTISWDLSQEINLENMRYDITSSLYF